MAKMNVCKVCKATFAEGAKSRPSCGAKRRKPVLTKVLLLILLAFITLSVATSCSKTDGKSIPATATPTSVTSSDMALLNLDEFINRYNAYMDEVEYQATFGIDAKITMSDLIIKPGEVNDTVQIILPDYKGGAVQLNLVKNTKNIKEIWLFLLTRGPSIHPERMLELFGVLAECAGAVKEGSDVVEVMYKLGLYGNNAFEIDKEASIESNGVNIGYSIMNIQNNLYLFGFATP